MEKKLIITRQKIVDILDEKLHFRPKNHYTKMGIIPNHVIPNHVIPNWYYTNSRYTNSRYTKSRYTKSRYTKSRYTKQGSAKCTLVGT
jgi:hypothetical protein